MIKDKYFRALFVIAIVVILAIFASCNPYEKIAVAPKITPANKELLSQTCERYFPPGEPKFIKGETIIKIDTIKQSDSVEIKRLLNLLLQTGNKGMNVDSLYLVFKATIKPIKIIIDNSRVDTFETPPNKYEINRLNTTIVALEKQHNEDLIKIAVLENDNEKLRQQNRKNQFTKFSGWGLIVLILGIYAVIKFKF